MAVIILQHVAVEGPGRIGAALDRAGQPWRVLALHDGQDVPVGPAGLDGLVVMGGPMGVHDAERFPHLVDEQNLIADCLDAGVPMLGVCLGSQLIAATLGADVTPGPVLELGWEQVRLTPDGTADSVLGQLPPAFTPLHWHGDRYALPPGADHLAGSEQTEVQAFRVGDSTYGLLFHLEVDAQQTAAMAAAFPDDLTQAGTTARELQGGSAGMPTAAADRAFDAWVSLTG